MTRKKKPGHASHERWLISYADFITLLFALFVVLFASSQADKKKQGELAKAMQTAFTEMGAFDGRGRRESAGRADPAATAPLVSDVGDLEMQLRKRLVAKAVASGMPAGSVQLRTTPEGVVISLREFGFFASGSASVREQAMPLLVELAQSLPVGRVRVEGHTDDVPIRTAQFPSNWELSSGRAAAIARILLDHGDFPPQGMAAAGLAEFHPVASNATDAGRAENRRVDVIVLRPVTP